MSKPFKFSLEKVLEVRIQREEQAQQKLAQARLEYQTQSELVKKLKNDLLQHQAKFLAQKNLTQAELWLWTTYQNKLKADIVVAEKKLQFLGQKVNRYRQEVIFRSKERKLLEKFKQKQMIRYEHDQKQKEQKEFDEMAVLRFQER
ncbi:flagellar export protein FliJ [Desulfovulcanus sp.]